MNRNAPEARPLPVADWPRFDRDAWTIACLPADPLDPKIGFAERWKPPTRRLNQSGYGLFMAWLKRTGDFHETCPPEERATPACLKAFLEMLRGRGLADNTVAGRLQQVANVLMAIAPHCDWSWISCASGRIYCSAILRNDPTERLQLAEDVLALASAMRLRAEQETRWAEIRRAILFRDGLIIAGLVRRPLRAANFCALSLGSSFDRHVGSWRIRFESEAVKNGQTIDCFWPADLVEPLERYLAVYRPVLLRRAGRTPTDALWVSQEGLQLSHGQFAHQINAATKAEFGTAINPHSFRHIAATTIATLTPEAALEIKEILFHTTIETSERYYNRAKMLGASVTYHARLAAVRRHSRKRGSG